MENFPALWQLLQLPFSDRTNLKVILGPLWAYRPGGVKHDGLTGRERTVALINSRPTWSRKEGALTHATSNKDIRTNPSFIYPDDGNCNACRK
jgi:hypothetical protein